MRVVAISRQGAKRRRGRGRGQRRREVKTPGHFCSGVRCFHRVVIASMSCEYMRRFLVWRPPGAAPKWFWHPGLRRLSGASPGAMHGPALRAELGRSDIFLPRSSRSAESAKHTSPGQARLLPRSGRSAESAIYYSPGQATPKARAALGGAPYWSVFLGLFGPSRRS